MLDRYGRNIDYLRISVTQDCNLRCIYCATPVLDGYTPKLSNNQYLSADEIGRLTRTMARLGIRKIRLTGGEPLLRRDSAAIIKNIAAIPEITDLALTTNAIGLDEQAKELKNAGLKRVNISMDSLDSGKFAFITGGGELGKVLKGIKTAVDVGLMPVKINIVVMKGINDDEIDRFIELARENPVDIRFIELMPLNIFGRSDRVVYNSDILKTRPQLTEIIADKSETAKYYTIAGYAGRIGFISPISHRFCNYCNRIRLTGDGKLKPCLGENTEIDMATVLRNNPEKLEWFIKKAIRHKPAGYQFGESFVSKRGMAAIGG